MDPMGEQARSGNDRVGGHGVIDIRTMIMIIGFLVTIGGIIGAYFSMQTRQNMKLEQHEKKLEEVEKRLDKDINGVRITTDKEISDIRHKQSSSTSHQIEMEKTLGIIVTKMDRLLQDIEELKANGCGRCS
jgi:ABC-type Fe3+-citrate transport system substrate-binding protein